MSASYPVYVYGKRQPLTIKKSTKVRSYVRGANPFVVKFKAFMRRVTITTLLAVIVASSYVSTYFAGGLFASTDRVQAQVVEHVVQTQAPRALPAVMKRIGNAETHNNQFCSDDAITRRFCTKAQKGEVLETTNKNRSVDIGQYAINNAAWGGKAVELGYNIYTQEGNEDMAMWIYQNVGTGPWYSSQANW